MFRKQFAYFFLVSIIVTTALAEGNIGEVCFMRDTQARGICKLSTDCQIAQESASRGISPTLCSFPALSNKLVFCCEGAQNTGSSFPEVNENSFLHTIENSGNIWFPEDPVPQIHRSRSEAKCLEYTKLVTGSVSAAPLITDPEDGIISIEVPKCEYSSIALIVGGEPALPGEFPFMAAVGYNSEDGLNGIGWFCGGTLLSEYYVVTAAHCAVTKFNGPPVKVRLGELDFKKENDGSQYVDYKIVDIKIHEKYRPPSRYNDIALLKLATRVKFTNYIRPACIWAKQTFDTDKSVATGWGKIGIADEPSDKLLKVTLNIYDNQRCSKHFPPESRTLAYGIQPTMMCAGGTGGNDTCQGDSGGPLVVTTKENACVFHLIGITSFGKGCGGSIPAVYTRVSQYVTWIENIIW